MNNHKKVTHPDRIILPYTFDANQVTKEITKMALGNFVYYDAIPLRAPAHLVDRSRDFPPPAEDYADGSWTEWLDTIFLQNSAYLSSMVNFFKANTKVTLVRLLRLAPGSVVKEHSDPTLGIEVERSVIRLTMPICGEEKVAFYLNDTKVPMKAGECWYLRLTDPHRVVNHGDQVRINLTIDMIPNPWVRSMLTN